MILQLINITAFWNTDMISWRDKLHSVRITSIHSILNHKKYGPKSGRKWYMFNEICINEEMLPKYTYIYIYIYIYIYSSLITLFLNDLFELICLHTVKWFQVLLFNNTNSVHNVFLWNIDILHTAMWSQIIAITICSKWWNSSIWPIVGTLTGTTNLGKIGPGSNGNKGVLHILQSSWIRALPSDAV